MKTFKCLLCGRDKFSRPGEPHKCWHGFTKRFKKAAAQAGLANAFKKNQAEEASQCQKK